MLEECTHAGIACFPSTATALQVLTPRCMRRVRGRLSALARTLRSMSTDDRDPVKIVELCADPVRTAWGVTNCTYAARPGYGETRKDLSAVKCSNGEQEALAPPTLIIPPVRSVGTPKQRIYSSNLS